MSHIAMRVIPTVDVQFDDTEVGEKSLQALREIDLEPEDGVVRMDPIQYAALHALTDRVVPSVQTVITRWGLDE